MVGSGAVARGALLKVPYLGTYLSKDGPLDTVPAYLPVQRREVGQVHRRLAEAREMDGRGHQPPA